MKPKYKYDEKVSFNINGKTINGSIFIIDSMGIFGDNSSVYYDILSKEENCLYKHIKEDEINQ